MRWCSFENKKLIVRAGKGDKDRVTVLPESLQKPLLEQREAARKLYDKDRSEKVAGVWLPEALGRKFRRGGERWEWFSDTWREMTWSARSMRCELA